MRLLLVNYEYPPIGAGAATATVEIARAATKLGHEVTVLTSGFGERRGWSSEGGILVRRLNSRRRRADRSTIAEMASFVCRAAVALPAVRRRSRAQACIVFFSMPCGPLGLLFRGFSPRPFIVSLRGGDVPGTELHLASMHRLLAPLRRLVLSRARAVVANSAGLAALSEKADRAPVRVIPNGVDTDRFSPPAAQPSLPFHFLFVGRLNAQKNVSLLLRAAQRLRASQPLPFRLTIVGDGPLRAGLIAQARELGLDELIEWKQWFERERMPALYASAHCVVNPSHYEGMPNVVLEAMSCGVPVVVSDVAGNRDVVAHRRSGLIVPADDLDQLAAAMELAVTHPEELAQLGTNARADVLARYSWEATARAYIALFESSTA